MLKILINSILIFLFSLLKVLAIGGSSPTYTSGNCENIILKCHREIQLRYGVKNLGSDMEFRGSYIGMAAFAGMQASIAAENLIQNRLLQLLAYSGNLKDQRTLKNGTFRRVDDELSPIGTFYSGAIRKPALRSLRNRHLGHGGREIGFNAGTSHSLTDIEGTKGQTFGRTLNLLAQDPGLSFGVYYRIRMVDWFGLSVGLDFASLSGRNTDVLSAFYNNSFTNSLVEFNSRIIFFAPLPTITVFDIYGFSGFSMFVNFLSLKNQHGQRMEPDEFSRVQLAIPFGIGFSRLIGNRFVAGYEIGYRHTAFNMLDGVAPPDTRNDAFLFNTLRFGIILNP